MELNEIDAILFDNDGVLVDTEPLFLQATQEIFDSIGLTLDEATFREVSLVQGGNMFAIVEREKGYTTEEIGALRAKRDDRYEALICEGVEVLEGVEDALARLHGRRPMAIVTSSGRHHFERIHAQTGLLRFFDFVLADGDYAKHKPHPDPYLAAAGRYGVAPGRCLAIEDTQRGLESATAAGMACCVIPHALSSAGNFERAVRVLPSMRGLTDWLSE